MANKNVRLRPAQIEADSSSFAALQGMAGYDPANPLYAVAALTQLQVELTSAQAAARDNAVAMEWE
jgi:hypothetical protein